MIGGPKLESNPPHFAQAITLVGGSGLETEAPSLKCWVLLVLQSTTHFHSLHISEQQCFLTSVNKVYKF